MSANENEHTPLSCLFFAVPQTGSAEKQTDVDIRFITAMTSKGYILFDTMKLSEKKYLLFSTDNGEAGSQINDWKLNLDTGELELLKEYPMQYDK